MLTGMKYRQYIHALRLLVEELLHPILQDQCIKSHAILQEYSTEKSKKTRTTKFWVSVLMQLLAL